MNPKIRKATNQDIETIAKNVVSMAHDGSQVTLDPEVVLQGVKSLFNKPELGFYIVAELDNRIVGSLVIVFEWSDWRNGAHWWIHSVYVDPDFRRNGIYRHMYNFITNEAKSNPEAISINLSVNEKNTVARSTYEKLGMKESNSVIYHAPSIND